MSAWVSKIGWSQALVAGFFLGIGFVVPTLWGLGLVAVVWSLYFIKNASSYTQLIKLLFLMWWIKSLCSLSWYISIYPIQWIDFSNQVSQLMLLLFYWSTSSAWLALGAIVFAISSRFLFLQKHQPTYVWYCFMPIIWLVSELFSGLTFAVFSFGPGSIIDSYFVSQGMTGYLLGTSSLGVWLAAVAGVYGLSFILISAACFILFVFETKRIKYLVAFIVAAFLLNLWSVNRELAHTNVGVTVISVDTQFDAELLSDKEGEQIKVDTVRAAVDTAVEHAPTFVLLPEDSRYLNSQYDSNYPGQAMSMFLFTHKNTESILIDSGRHETENGSTVLRANVFDGVSKKMWQFDKQYLVPQGEYIPYLYQAFFSVLGYGSAVDAIAQDSSYRPGPLLQTDVLPLYIPGVLFCFESSSPTGVPKLTKLRPLPFVAHPVSHAWFHNPTVLWQQLDVMLQLQARYSGVPIVSAGNMAQGKLYLPNGKVETGRVIIEGNRYQLREFRF